MKICLGPYGLYGDLCIATTLLETFKYYNPDSTIIFCAGRRYSSILPLFYNHPFIYGFHVWEGHDDWPTARDQEYINKNNFDKVYTARPQHKDTSWYKKINYPQEFHKYYDFPEPINQQCYLEKWFEIPPKNNQVITTSLSSGGDAQFRSLNSEQINNLYKNIEKLGYKIVRLDTKYDPYLEDEYPASKLDWVSATQRMLSARLHLTVNTSWEWISSAYSHPTLALHGINYPDMTLDRVVSHIAVNPNATALVSENVQNIPIDKIIENIKKF